MTPGTYMKLKNLALSINAFMLILNCSLNSTTAAASELFSNLTEQEEQNIKIERSITADTVVLETGEKIKLIGLLAPPLPKKASPQYDSFGFVIPPVVTPETPIEEQSLHFVQKLLEKQLVRLEFDVQRKDESNYSLAYIFLPDGTFVNAEILKNGLANLQIRPPNLKYEDKLREAYREARREKRGLQSE